MSILMTSFLQLSDYRDSDSRLKLNDLANKSNMTNIKFSIQTLVKEIKLVLTFEGEFGNGEPYKRQVREFLDSQNSETGNKIT